MKIAILISLAVLAQSINFSKLKAHCQIHFEFDLSCEEVLTNVSNNILQTNWARQYAVIKYSPAAHLYTKRTVFVLGNEVDDEVELVLSEGHSCMVFAQSQSVVPSYYDFKQNYCNIALLFKNIKPKNFWVSQCKSKYNDLEEALQNCKV